MDGLLTFCSKLEQTDHGNGEGDTAMIEGTTMKSHPPFSFINIGQRGRMCSNKDNGLLDHVVGNKNFDGCCWILQDWDMFNYLSIWMLWKPKCKHFPSVICMVYISWQKLYIGVMYCVLSKLYHSCGPDCECLTLSGFFLLGKFIIFYSIALRSKHPSFFNIEYIK